MKLPINELDQPEEPVTEPISDIDPDLFLVLAAATAAVLRNEHRIVAVSVSTVVSSAQPMLLWSYEGRRQIYSSHRIRH